MPIEHLEVDLPDPTTDTLFTGAKKQIVALGAIRDKLNEVVVFLSAPPVVAPPTTTPPTDRSGLVAGTYKPSKATTGLLPGYSRSTLPTKITPADPRCKTQNGIKQFFPASDTIYENVWFNVPVYVGPAKNVQFRNCSFDGNGIPLVLGTDLALLNCSASATGSAANNLPNNVIVEDCEFIPASPNNSVNGVRGCAYTLRRVYIGRCVDGIDLFNNAAGELNVRLEAIYVTELSYFNTVGDHKDNRTHNDCIQWAAGKNWSAIGCNLEAIAWPEASSGVNLDPYYPAVTGQGIGVTSNAGPCSGMTVTSSWLDGGNHALTAIVTSNTATRTNLGVLKDIRFGRRSKTSPIQISQYMTIAATGLVYENNGVPVTLIRAEA